MRSFAALSVVLAASSAALASPSPNVSLNPRDLIVRQVGPTTCQSQCAPVTQTMSDCKADLNCMCGSTVASAYYSCLQCGYGVAEADMKTTLQQGWDAYISGCKTVGVTVSQSPSLTGSSSSSSSSGSNSNTNNSNTGSSGNDASRSTSLGFIGLGAVAFAVSSLF